MTKYNGDIAKTAFGFVLVIGIVNFFADMTYEGARSITGPFLGSLGATATAVGVVAGTGELLGYGLRSVAGYFAGLNEGLDQAGATVGPLIVALVLYLNSGFRTGFGVLLVSSISSLSRNAYRHT
jgi:hypothetical protein